MRRARLTVSFAFIAVISLSGAQCGGSSPPASEATGGASTTIPVNAAAVTPTGTPSAASGPISDFFTCINGRRTTPLIWHAGLAGVAQAHANAMTSVPFYGFVDPSNGLDMPTRAVSSSITFTSFAQGIAKGYTSGSDLCNAIPSNFNILNSTYTKIGVGYSAGGPN